MQLGVRDVAKVLNVPERKIYRWIKERSLPAYRVGEQYRFNRAEVLEWATSRKIDVSVDLFAERDNHSHPAVALADALDRGGIFYQINGSDKSSVLRAVVEAMRLPEGVDREFLFRVLLAREALGSTGIGEGIAIPHPRNPIVLDVERPAIALCFLTAPIEFGALDGEPVRILFSLVSPTVREHLQLLSRLAFALRDPSFKAAVAREAARDEILKQARRIDSGLAQPVPVQATGEG